MYNWVTTWPPRYLTRRAITKVLAAYGRSVTIKQLPSGKTVYEEVGDWLGVDTALRRTENDNGENKWRYEVGWCRKDLVESGVIYPTDKGTSGVWKLKLQSSWSADALKSMEPESAQAEFKDALDWLVQEPMRAKRLTEDGKLRSEENLSQGNLLILFREAHRRVLGPA